MTTKKVLLLQFLAIQRAVYGGYGAQQTFSGTERKKSKFSGTISKMIFWVTKKEIHIFGNLKLKYKFSGTIRM